MVKKYSILVNGAVLFDNKVLIIKRSAKEKHQAGKWCLPGGKMELDDAFAPLQSTVIRELKEETGIIVNPKRLIYNNVFQHTEDKESTLAVVFYCELIEGCPKPLEDTDEVQWIKESEIDDYEFPPNVKKYIQIAFKYNEYAEI
jgi:8-oxo-dGTP diphosphatase